MLRCLLLPIFILTTPALALNEAIDTGDAFNDWQGCVYAQIRRHHHSLEAMAACDDREVNYVVMMQARFDREPTLFRTNYAIMRRVVEGNARDYEATVSKARAAMPKVR